MRTGDRFRSLITVEFKYSGTGIHIREKRIAKEVSNCEIKCYTVKHRALYVSFLVFVAINYDGAYAALFQYVNLKTCIRKAISA